MDRLIAWYRMTSSAGAVVALIAANAIPLLGVLFLGWNVWTILIVYWLENGVVGAFNIAKMAKAEGDATGMDGAVRINGRPASAMAKVGLIPFFVMHYGIFWAVHGVFVLTLPVFGSMGPDGGSPDMVDGFDPATIVLAVIALTISHAVSFWFNFLGAGEYLRATAAGQMFAPYGRLVVLHITIILGGAAIAITGAPAEWSSSSSSRRSLTSASTSPSIARSHRYLRERSPGSDPAGPALRRGARSLAYSSPASGMG